MSMEHWWNVTDAATEAHGGNSVPVPIFYHRFHVDPSRIEHGPPRWEADEKPPRTWQKYRRDVSSSLIYSSERPVFLSKVCRMMCAEC